MGCCLSSNNTESESSKPHLSKPNISSFLKKDNPNSTPTPPTNPLVEEETVVKEVLSETPSLPKQPISLLSQNEPIKEPLEHSSPNAKLVSRPDNLVPPTRYSPKAKVGDNPVPVCYSTQKTRLDYSQNPHSRRPQTKKPERIARDMKLPPSEELSEEVSEICSTLSESCISSTTAATTETNHFADDDNEVTQTARRNMSPAKHLKRQPAGDRLEGRPQRRRSEASPGRVRSGPVRDGRGLNNCGMKRGPVIGPQRRSRSPVTRVDGAGSRTGLSRCPSGRRTGKSPGRFRPPELLDKNSKLEQADPKVENGGNSDAYGEAKLDPTNDESLENPHVSMECFIFL